MTEPSAEELAKQKRRHAFRESQIQLERIAGMLASAMPLEGEKRDIVVRTLQKISRLLESEYEALKEP